MANVNIKFNNKDYLLSCDDGQEDSLKELAIDYKEGKDKEISKLNNELDLFKKTIEESNNLYESMLDKTTESLEKILSNTESNSKIQ